MLAWQKWCLFLVIFVKNKELYVTLASKALVNPQRVTEGRRMREMITGLRLPLSGRTYRRIQITGLGLKDGILLKKSATSHLSFWTEDKRWYLLYKPNISKLTLFKAGTWGWNRFQNAINPPWKREIWETLTVHFILIFSFFEALFAVVYSLFLELFKYIFSLSLSLKIYNVVHESAVKICIIKNVNHLVMYLWSTACHPSRAGNLRHQTKDIMC